MKPFLRMAAALAVVSLVGGALAASLTIGSKAPALSVKTWYKGKPVKEFSPNGTYVVEFWATWCGPCRTSIPHLTKLAKANPKVTFVGVSIWEDDKDGNIQKFVDEMGNQMDYNVGYSGNQDGMAVTWMKAAGQNGIPSAFIVKNRQVVWIGHPMEMDAPLAEIAKGTFDVKKAKAEFDRKAAAEEAQMKAFRELQAITKLRADGKKDEAYTKLAEFTKANPQLADQANGNLLRWLLEDDIPAFDRKVEAMLADGNADSSQSVIAAMLGSINMDPKADNSKGLEDRTRAVEAAVAKAQGKDFITLYYASLFFRTTKQPQKAAPQIKAALALQPTSEFKDNAQVKQTLEGWLKEQEALIRPGQ